MPAKRSCASLRLPGLPAEVASINPVHKSVPSATNALAQSAAAKRNCTIWESPMGPFTASLRTPKPGMLG